MSSTLMKSPTLNGLENTMNRPLTMLDRASCEARPTAMARIPALARMELLIFSIPGISERKAAQPTMYTAATTIWRMKLVLVSSSVTSRPCLFSERLKKYFTRPVTMRTNRYIIAALMQNLSTACMLMPKRLISIIFSMSI